MLRTTSTYTVAILRTIQLRDSLPIPTRVPRIVAAMTPATHTRNVLSRPWYMACLTEAFCDRVLPVIWNDAGLSRNLKFVGMFARDAFVV